MNATADPNGLPLAGHPAEDEHPGLAALFARMVLRMVRMAWPLVLASAVYACACVGLWRHAQAHHQSAGSAMDRVELVGLPPWLDAKHRESIQAAANGLKARSLMDKDLPQRLAQAYLQAPWVEAVTRVRRRFPDRIQVELSIREPLAQVRLPQGKGYVWIDRHGVRLPLGPFAGPRGELPVFSGVPDIAPPEGQPYSGRDVADALEILRVVRATMETLPAAEALAVTGIASGPTTSTDRQRSFALQCRDPKGHPVRLIWGVHYRPREIPPYGIPLTDEKLRALKLQLLAIARTGKAARLIDVSVNPSVYSLAPDVEGSR